MPPEQEVEHPSVLDLGDKTELKGKALSSPPISNEAIKCSALWSRSRTELFVASNGRFTTSCRQRCTRLKPPPYLKRCNGRNVQAGSVSDNAAFPISTVLCMRLPRPWHVAIWQSKCKQEIRLPHSLPPSLLSPDACVSRRRCVKNKLAKSQYNVMLQQRRWLEIPAHFGCCHDLFSERAVHLIKFKCCHPNKSSRLLIRVHRDLSRGRRGSWGNEALPSLNYVIGRERDRERAKQRHYCTRGKREGGRHDSDGF